MKESIGSMIQVIFTNTAEHLLLIKSFSTSSSRKRAAIQGQEAGWAGGGLFRAKFGCVCFYLHLVPTKNPFISFVCYSTKTLRNTVNSRHWEGRDDQLRRVGGVELPCKIIPRICPYRLSPEIIPKVYLHNREDDGGIIFPWGITAVYSTQLHFQFSMF